MIEKGAVVLYTGENRLFSFDLYEPDGSVFDSTGYACAFSVRQLDAKIRHVDEKPMTALDEELGKWEVRLGDQAGEATLPAGTEELKGFCMVVATDGTNVRKFGPAPFYLTRDKTEV